MKTVPAETIEELVQRFADLNEAAFEALCEEAYIKQPFVLEYLMASDELIAEDGHESQIMQLGVFVYMVMSVNNPGLTLATEEQIDKAEEKNVEFLNRLDEGSELDFAAAVEKQHLHYNQKHLLAVLLESLMADHAENPELAPEGIGMEFLCLKTVIDCLDQ